MHHHELKIEATAAAVTEWQTNVRTITDKIAKAQAVLAESKKTRNEQVFAAAMGDHEVRKHLDHALEQERAAEIDLEILRSSLRHAEAELRTAENAQRAAHLELRKAEQIRLARARVEAARKIDAALAEFSSSWAEYSEIGRALYAVSDDYPNQIYLAEHLDGLLRLAAALPHQPFFDIRHKHSFCQLGGGAPLAVSEAAFWRLPTAEVKAA